VRTVFTEVAERCETRVESSGRFVGTASVGEPADDIMVCDGEGVQVAYFIGVSPKCLQKCILSAPNPFLIGHLQFAHSFPTLPPRLRILVERLQLLIIACAQEKESDWSKAYRTIRARFYKGKAVEEGSHQRGRRLIERNNTISSIHKGIV